MWDILRIAVLSGIGVTGYGLRVTHRRLQPARASPRSTAWLNDWKIITRREIWRDNDDDEVQIAAAMKLQINFLTPDCTSF